MTKKTFLLTAFLAFGLLVSAQESNGYYFKDFTPGRVILKNKQFARGKFNYDFVNRQMHFLNGKTDMIVENLEDIDTVIIDKTRFIPLEGRFLEVMKGKKSVVLIEKEVKTRERGKEGAMGLATQGSVQAIDVNARFQRVNGDNNMDLTIYKEEIENVYFIFLNISLHCNVALAIFGQLNEILQECWFPPVIRIQKAYPFASHVL